MKQPGLGAHPGMSMAQQQNMLIGVNSQSNSQQNINQDMAHLGFVDQMRKQAAQEQQYYDEEDEDYQEDDFDDEEELLGDDHEGDFYDDSDGKF